MSFAQRAKAGREEGAGGFEFPKLRGWTRLKGWKFGLSTKKNPMFTLELKLLDEGLEVLSTVNKRDGTPLSAADLKGKVLKERVVVSAAADWQFDKFLAYLEDSGMDLSQMDDKDPTYQDIQDALEYLEDKGQRIKVELDPQEGDKRYYRLKFVEVQKVADGVGGPVVVDPPSTPAQVVGAAAVAAVQTVAAASTPAPAADPAPVATQPAAAPVQTAPPVADPAPAAGARKKKPWEK